MGADFVANRGGVMMQIGISLKIFHTYAEQLQRYDLDDCFWRNNNVNLLPTEMAEIKNYLQQIFRLAVYKPTWLHQPHIEQLVTDDFIPLFMSQIPIKRNSKSFFKPFRQSPLIVRAEQKMLNYLDKPLTLKQLAEDLESSSSALSRGFRNLFGISPMRYLKVRRLHAVRQHLKASEPEDCTIAILANQFGFYNPSHFTKDYKIMFGELPSETLRNKASVNLNIDIDDIEIRGRKSLLDRYML
ncbi:MAG: helix-turn-helix domain-containing protein [Cyanobacteria bacterium P01_E01_bin.42]